MQKAAAEIIASIKILSEEKDKRACFYELSKQKQLAIIKNDIQALSLIVRSEENILRELSGIEKKRNLSFAALCGVLGVPESLTLIELTQVIEDKASCKMINDIRDEMLQIVTKQKNINENNRKLINIKLEYTQNMVMAMTQTAVPMNNYDDLGNTDTGEQRIRLVDRQI